MLCNYLGQLVERGEYFSGEDELRILIENVCYRNAKEFFGFCGYELVNAFALYKITAGTALI